jgi:hypothetical protein
MVRRVWRGAYTVGSMGEMHGKESIFLAVPVANVKKIDFKRRKLRRLLYIFDTQEGQ